MLKWTKV